VMNNVESIYKAQRVRDAGLSEGDEYNCGCGEIHTVKDPTFVVLFEHKPWHIDCLTVDLGDHILELKRLLKHPAEALGIAPITSPNGVVWCSRDKACDGYSQLQNGNHYCVKARASITEGKPCMVWLAALMHQLNSWTNWREL